MQTKYLCAQTGRSVSESAGEQACRAPGTHPSGATFWGLLGGVAPAREGVLPLEEELIQALKAAVRRLHPRIHHHADGAALADAFQLAGWGCFWGLPPAWSGTSGRD